MELWVMRKWSLAPSEFYDLPDHDRERLVDYAYHFKAAMEKTIKDSKKSRKKKDGSWSKATPDPEIVKLVLPYLFEMK